MSAIAGLENAYAAVTHVDGAVSETERRRLEQQAEVYSRLAGWTLDALGLAPGHRVLEVGCGGGSLLAAAAARVGPTGRVVGIDRDPRLVEAAKTDRKSTRLNSSHLGISYAVFCLRKKKTRSTLRPSHSML